MTDRSPKSDPNDLSDPKPQLGKLSARNRQTPHCTNPPEGVECDGIQLGSRHHCASLHVAIISAPNRVLPPATDRLGVSP